MTPRPGGRSTGLVTIVVPAKDEEEAIGATLRSLPIATLQAAGHDVEVVVLDGRSTDRTAEIARAWGAVVVTDSEPGKGSALRNARAHLRGDYIIMLDGDGTYAPDAIPRVLDLLSWGDADIVMGCRRTQTGSMTGVHRVGNVLLSFGASVLYARRCPDLCTGMWGFRAHALHALPLRSRGFELEAEIFACASRLRLKIGYAPVDYLPRRGRTKLSTGDGLRIGWCLVESRFRSFARPPVPTRVRPGRAVPTRGR